MILIKLDDKKRMKKDYCGNAMPEKPSHIFFERALRSTLTESPIHGRTLGRGRENGRRVPLFLPPYRRCSHGGDPSSPFLSAMGRRASTAIRTGVGTTDGRVSRTPRKKRLPFFPHKCGKGFDNMPTTYIINARNIFINKEGFPKFSL